MVTVDNEATIASLSGRYPVEASQKVYIRRKDSSQKVRGQEASEESWYVGAALKGDDTLRGLSFEEEKVYLKDIIGVSPQGEKWEEATKNYWCNIRVLVPSGIGREIEVGFAYKTEEERNLAETSKDFAVKERYGRPINVADYILFRYCLVYKAVARSFDDIYKSPKIRFYIFSRAEELATKADDLRIRDQATVKRITVMSDRQLVDDILVLYDEPTESLSNEEKDIALEKYSKDNPIKFVQIAGSPTIKQRSFIERCVKKGILRRYEGTDTIVYGDNEVVGYSLDEAVVNLERPNKVQLLNTLRAKMQLNPTLRDAPVVTPQPVVVEEYAAPVTSIPADTVIPRSNGLGIDLQRPAQEAIPNITK